MDRNTATGLHVDPLADLEVQRALALARARESYPAVPRENLLGYCEAAWEVALKADPRGRDLQGSFDRALLIIAWTQRRSGGRVPLRELIDQTVPRIALEPFIGRPAEVGENEPTELGVQPEEAVPSRRSPLRLPFTSPIPVGAALAAGVVGVALLSEAEVIPIAPLQPAGSDDSAGADDVASRDAAERKGDRASGAGAAQSDEMVAGLLPEGIGTAAGQAFAAPPAAAGDDSPGGSPGPSAVAAEASGGAVSNAAARAAGGTGSSQIAAETAGAQAAPPAPVAPAPPAPQPVVRVEMAPPTMILEVSAPQRPSIRTDDDEDSREQQDPGGPDSDTGVADDPDDDAGRGDEDDEGPLDFLEDTGRPDAGSGDEEDAEDEDEIDGDEEDGDEDDGNQVDGDEAAPAPPPEDTTSEDTEQAPAAPRPPSPPRPFPPRWRPRRPRLLLPMPPRPRLLLPLPPRRHPRPWHRLPPQRHQLRHLTGSRTSRSGAARSGSHPARASGLSPRAA